MPVEIVSQKPRTRCYACGQTAVASICHHCGRAMCSQHASFTSPDRAAAENPEFTGLDLGLGPVGEAGMHCEACAHSVRTSSTLIWSGVVVAVLGLLALFTSMIAEPGRPGDPLGALSAIVALIGMAVAILGILVRRIRFRDEMVKQRPPLPVVGTVQSPSIWEGIRGQIALDELGRYTTAVEQPEGQLSLTLSFTPRDRDRLAAYRKKFRLSADEDVQFHAGFGVLHGAVDLRFADPGLFPPGRVNTAVLIGRVADQPFFAGDGKGQASRWNIAQKYRFAVEKKTAFSLPVQIVPTLVQGEARQAIELALQLPPETGAQPAYSGTLRVERLELRAPQSLGHVERAQPPAVGGATRASPVAEEPSQIISWTTVNADRRERAARRKSFYVRFQNPIEPDTVLTGRLRVCFEGALSDVEDITLFYPLGNQREKVSLQRQTFVDVEFSLHLGSLRFQEKASTEKRIVREGVVPDHRMITALTNSLSRAGFYVKRVIENPPHTSKAGASIANRLWDVAGRYYEGVYPVDFHLVLAGEESYGGGRYAGKIQADVTVQGTVTDQEMRDTVVYQRDRLLQVIGDALDLLPRSLPEAPPASPEPAARGGSVEDVGRVEPPAQPSDADRSAALRARLDKLDEALIDGRVSEARYEEMRARILAQLGALAESGQAPWIEEVKNVP